MIKEKKVLKCSKEDCTGCGGCAFVCPKQAIKMEKTKDGFGVRGEQGK